MNCFSLPVSSLIFLFNVCDQVSNLSLHIYLLIISKISRRTSLTSIIVETNPSSVFKWPIKWKTKTNTTLSERFQCLTKNKYHTVRTVPMSNRKQIPHCRNGSNVYPKNVMLLTDRLLSRLCKDMYIYIYD
jgi:hypothetical protein